MKKEVVSIKNSETELVSKIAQLRLEFGNPDAHLDISKIADDFARVGGIMTGKLKAGVDVTLEEIAIICTDGIGFDGAVVEASDDGRFVVICNAND